MMNLEDIKTIAVLGAGTMGPGIAQVYAAGGYEVNLWTRSESTMEKAKAALSLSLDNFVEEEEYSKEEADAIFGRIHFTADMTEAVSNAQFIQETIVEKREAKEELYSQLADILTSDVMIASNTSALNIFEIVPEKLLPQQIICHWYAPPQLIPLVEVVKSEEAPMEYAETAMALLRKCGKTAVFMKKFIRGYIVNRLQQCIHREVFHLIDNGYCDAEAVDLASKASWIPRACVLGICKRIDFGGVDMTANNYINKSYTMPENGDELPKTLKACLDENRLGIKTGKGLYDYEGKDLDELKTKRDHQLFEVFRLEKKFLDDAV